MTNGDPSHAGAVLDTPRLLLRLWEEADAPAMFQAFSDPEVMRHWNTPLAVSVAEVAEAIRRSRTASPNAHAAWIAVLKHEGRAAGFVNYHRRDVSARCLHVGYLLSRPFWGAGLATEAVSALLGHCFGPLGILRLWRGSTREIRPPYACSRAWASGRYPAGGRTRATVWRRSRSTIRIELPCQTRCLSIPDHYRT